MERNVIALNGSWLCDYISDKPYKSEVEPLPDNIDLFCELFEAGKNDCITKVTLPNYFEDLLDLFRSTPLHTKLSWNPLYTLQRYPQTGYCPDMALPNPVGCFAFVRSFTLTGSELSSPARLYVGGVQNTLSAWINGRYIGRHEGYSCEFSLDIPEGALKSGENRITLAVSNNRLEGYMGRPVSGLTSRAANECTGGVWGDIEIRFMPDGLSDVWVSTAKDLESFTVNTVGGEATLKSVEIYDGERLLFGAEIPEGQTSLKIPTDGFEFWSPMRPRLYTARVITENQTLDCRFGIRRLTSEGKRLYLNGKPYFFRGTCEHCYHPITVHPTREKAYYRRVLKTLKELGFNSIRFHTYVPMPEYMEAADELGMLIEVETPNNTTYSEWRDIVIATRRHASVCAYSSGNEMVIDEDYIEHLRAAAELVHGESDSLFSPMSAMRGIEYHSYGDCKVVTPFPHNPKRLAALSEFSDLYNTYSLGQTSYSSDKGSPELLDYRNSIYDRPLLTHEICIQGTYIDLSLIDRYKGTRIGDTEFMTSVVKHLSDVGILDKASLYYKNSVKWQMLLRKICFENVRRCESFAGYDFLGDIDTHWHTFGYCVGMMNEFYELKAGESVRNVLTYNSDTVLLCDLPYCRNVNSGDKLSLPILVSNYGEALEGAALNVTVRAGDKVIYRKSLRALSVPAGEITPLYTANLTLPSFERPEEIKIRVQLYGGDTDRENEWSLYSFPRVKEQLSSRKLKARGITVLTDVSAEELLLRMSRGESVVLFGKGPFTTLPTTFQLSVAGRTTGHLATVVDDHPIFYDIPNDGHCDLKFREMLSDGEAAVLDIKDIPHNPIIDIASTYKNAHREAMLFEYRVGEGRLLVCTLNLKESDPFAAYLKKKILEYAIGSEFVPRDRISLSTLSTILGTEKITVEKNANEAQNKNDITMNV